MQRGANGSGNGEGATVGGEAGTKMKKTVVLNLVAMTGDYISESLTPNLWKYTSAGANVTRVDPMLPAVTCVSQSTFLTGKPPSEHGITANGYYDERLKQQMNWHQSAGNVQAPRLFSEIKQRDPSATVFVHTWWHGMYDDDIDYFITVRPEYRSDGKKFPNTYAKPAGIRDKLHEKYGKYPLHRFWGPMTSIESSRWIANTAMEVDRMFDPTASFIYLPHMDYNLQKFGTDKTLDIIRSDLKELDDVFGDLVAYYEGTGAELVVLSEYGISPVTKAVHINRELRKAGYISVVKERCGETLDCGASAAFAAPDHQVAHVHVKDPANLQSVKALLKGIDGVDTVLEPKDMPEAFFPGRAGDLIAVADEDKWFTYYFWQDDKDAPDYARCVAIHDKPGYDPTEMFLRFEKPHKWMGVCYLLMKAVLSMLIGVRTLVDATPLDRADDIRGSHGRIPTDPRYKPIIASPTIAKTLGTTSTVKATSVYGLLLSVLTRA